MGRERCAFCDVSIDTTKGVEMETDEYIKLVGVEASEEGKYSKGDTLYFCGDYCLARWMDTGREFKLCQI